MSSEMMTLEQLHESSINPDVAKEAYVEAGRRLADVLSIKAAYEQKALALFGGYLTLSLGLFGAGKALNHAGFWFAGVFFVAGAILFVLAQLDGVYGVVGSSPDMWLRKGVIDGNDQALPAMYAYLTYYHLERITKSQQRNGRKATLIRWGIFAGIGGPAILVIWAIGQWLAT
jgi:hypothetical protein